MIIDIPATTTGAVAKKLIKLREEGGAVALGRVLTLIILADEGCANTAIDAANVASREHPCRIIVLITTPTTSGSLDAEIRVGGDAGASEVILLRGSRSMLEHADTLIMPLLLPDAPIVAWWPGTPPDKPSTDPIGAMAHRRITDCCDLDDPQSSLARLRSAYEPGDTDLAWTRTTLWRSLIAATLDLPPFEPVRSARVTGNPAHPSVDLIAAWLARQLRCPVEVERVEGAQAVTRVELTRRSGVIALSRPEGKVAVLSQPGQPDHEIPLPVRRLDECVSEELRRLDPDEFYGEVLERGLPKISTARASA